MTRLAKPHMPGGAARVQVLRERPPEGPVSWNSSRGTQPPQTPQPHGLADTDAVGALELALATEPDTSGFESWLRAFG